MITGIGAFDPDAVDLASAWVSDPFVAPTMGSSAAAEAAVALTGSICTACTVPSGIRGLPSRSRRSPRWPKVRSSCIVVPAGRSGCQGEPVAGVATCQRSPSATRVTGTAYVHGTSPGRVQVTSSVPVAVSPSRSTSPAVTATLASPRSLTAGAKVALVASSANGTLARSLAVHAFA